MGEQCLFFRQFEMEFRLEIVSNFLFGLLYSGDTIVTHHNEVIRVADETVVALSSLPSLGFFAHRDIPLCLCPLVKLIQVNIG